MRDSYYIDSCVSVFAGVIGRVSLYGYVFLVGEVRGVFYLYFCFCLRFKVGII